MISLLVFSFNAVSRIMSVNNIPMDIKQLRWIVVLLLIGWRCANANWWALSRMQLSAAHVDNTLQCSSPGMVRQQRSICLKNPGVLSSISLGVQLAIYECQDQFSDRRWNCSTTENGLSVFGKITDRTGSRETAYVYAISSAGVAYSIAKSCSRGDVSNCACDPVRKGSFTDSEGAFSWQGCGSFVNYGLKFARKFIDAREDKTRDARAMMNLHNNRAGRKAVKKFTEKMCKCHGPSGSCTARTCWKTVKAFREVGSYLKRQYDGAVRVTLQQADPPELVPEGDTKPFSKFNLVYIEDSPDFCTPNKNVGTVGTAGRLCRKKSQGPSSCGVMCCGMGYDTKRVEVVKRCNCKFNWCCEVKCDECRKMRDVYTCKASPITYARDKYSG